MLLMMMKLIVCRWVFAIQLAWSSNLVMSLNYNVRQVCACNLQTRVISVASFVQMSLLRYVNLFALCNLILFTLKLELLLITKMIIHLDGACH